MVGKGSYMHLTTIVRYDIIYLNYIEFNIIDLEGEKFAT
jgi:hypothetical protein